MRHLIRFPPYRPRTYETRGAMVLRRDPPLRRRRCSAASSRGGGGTRCARSALAMRRRMSGQGRGLVHAIDHQKHCCPENHRQPRRPRRCVLGATPGQRTWRSPARAGVAEGAEEVVAAAAADGVAVAAVTLGVADELSISRRGGGTAIIRPYFLPRCRIGAAATITRMFRTTVGTVMRPG